MDASSTRRGDCTEVLGSTAEAENRGRATVLLSKVVPAGTVPRTWQEWCGEPPHTKQMAEKAAAAAAAAVRVQASGSAVQQASSRSFHQTLSFVGLLAMGVTTVKTAALL